jgi:aerobic carbon-monoxide dehydrogenase large subunit
VPGATVPPGGWIGAPVRRVEDPALLSGHGSYVGDMHRPGMLHIAFVRSAVAAADVTSVDPAPALAIDGVRAVFSAEDLNYPGLRATLALPGFVETEMPLLAVDRIRHVGEPVALVVADSQHLAEDGAEAVVVDVEPRPVVTGLVQAQKSDAALVHDHAPDNRLLDVLFRDEPGIEAVLQGAAVRIDACFTSARVSAVPLEGRGCLAEWDARSERLTLYTSTQMPHLVRTTVADLLGLPESALRVVAPDVGGGFGQKVAVTREEVLVAAVALRLRRPVRWLEDRVENFVAGYSGHEQRHRVSAAFDADGTLQAVDADIECDTGAYSCFPFSCAVEPLMAAGEFSGPYRLPRYRVRTRAVATNKPTMAPYRGVSRPQITLAMERLMDKAARRLGLTPIEIRARNLIRRDEFPYEGITGIVYDEGSYLESLERCADLLDWASWTDRQAAARAQGRLLGLGFACFSERTGYGTPVFAARGMRVTPGFDCADVRMDPSGGVVVRVGTAAHGQGHRTTLAQIVAHQLGLTVEEVRVVEGDTDDTPYGWGTFASRTTVIAGGACMRAADGLAAKLRRIAAHVLEAAEEDIELRNGFAAVRGSPDAAVGVPELARLAYQAAHRLPPGESPGLQHSSAFDPPGTFSNATHGALVDVDPGTGRVRVQRYVVVEDCGVIINPMIVDGQVRGGVAQGIACALYEAMDFDQDGQCRTTTLMDYVVPTATEIPSIEIHHLQTPSEHSETGAKGMGEGGTIGAPAAVLGAVNDALAHLGIEIDDIPVTPDRIRACLRSVEGEETA